MAIRLPTLILKDGTVLEPPAEEPTFSDSLALERLMGSTIATETRIMERNLFYIWRHHRRLNARLPDDFDEFVDLIVDARESKNGSKSPKAPRVAK